MSRHDRRKHVYYTQEGRVRKYKEEKTGELRLRRQKQGIRGGMEINRAVKELIIYQLFS